MDFGRLRLHRRNRTLQADDPELDLGARAIDVRWSPSVGQFGGLDKLGSGCRQAANFSVPVALYASSGVRPASIEWGRRVL